MSFTIGLAQCRRPDDGDVLASVGRWVQAAKRERVNLLVFPEALMTKYDGSPEEFARQSQPADGAFARGVDELAARAGLWIAYTINERNPEGGLPYNTAVVVDGSGVQQARYRKTHLFNAQGFCESSYLSAGNELLKPVATPFATLGLGICYDLRFPEVARAAALADAQVMLYPAAWVAGTGKVDQWETLLRARAIENGFFVAGCCCVDEGRIGHSCVFAPDGAPLATSGDEEQLVTCKINLSLIDATRAATPSLQHRRPSCYTAE